MKPKENQITRQPGKTSKVEIMKERTEKVIAGEVIVVQCPHQLNTKLFWHINFDEAFDAWTGEAIFCKMSSLKEQKENGDFGKESFDEEGYNAVKELLAENDISEEDAYYEFGRGNSDIDEYIKAENLDKEYILSELIKDDMHSASYWIAEEDETYEEFAARIFDGTRGHNEPSMREIFQKLGVYDD